TSGALPLAPAGFGLQLLRTLELLLRAGIRRIAAAAHRVPGRRQELEQTEVGAVRGLRVEVRLALDDRRPLGTGCNEHGLDLGGAQGAPARTGVAAAGARVTGVTARVTGVRAARVAGVGAAGVGRGLLLLGALENHLGFGFGEDLLVLLLLLHLFAVDGLDLVDDLLRAVFA